MFLISMVFRRKARRSSGTIERASEGAPLIIIRIVFASLLYLPILAYMIQPEWMSWASVTLPGWLRFVGIGIGIVNLPFVYSVFKSIGSNISETVLTKDTHELVTTGPYRFIRHPLYAASSVGLIGFSLITANWFIAGMSTVAIVVVLYVVIPKEETHLVDFFGERYETYRTGTGRLLPRFFESPDARSMR
ncbi:MAG: isoprenylcysteine carboxylmethyltransferase family protein [Rhodothermales bacterium]|nr:isoprenylcysteine carboxylmethyltransferase family protein [Rhodothermales bacterium]